MASCDFNVVILVMTALMQAKAHPFLFISVGKCVYKVRITCKEC